MTSGYKAAIIPIKTLGDGLIYTLLAQSLNDIGFSVTFFSDLLSGLNQHFTSIEFNKNPNSSSELNKFDIIICEPFHIKIKEIILSDPELLKKTIWVACTREEKNLCKKSVKIHHPSKNTPHKFSGGVLFDSRNSKSSMVEHALSFISDTWKISPPPSPEINFPSLGNKKHNSRRILVFPFTPQHDNEYSLKRFIMLSKKLMKLGYEVEFIGTLDQQRRFSNEGNNSSIQFRSFSDLSSLIMYVYQSAFVIANDSGGGHLASLIDIPLVTIHKKNNSFKWRPGWRKSYIVVPSFNLKLLKRRIWRPFISQRKIISYICRTAPI